MPARLARPRPSSPIHLQLNGTTSSTKHGVAGTVRVEGNKIVIENFSIGKNAPAAYFYYGTDGCPSNPRNQLEFQEENERERQTILSKEGEIDITVHLNLPVDATQVKWVSVWCDKFNVDFGHAFLNNIQHQDCN